MRNTIHIPTLIRGYFPVYQFICVIKHTVFVMGPGVLMEPMGTQGPGPIMHDAWEDEQLQDFVIVNAGTAIICAVFAIGVFPPAFRSRVQAWLSTRGEGIQAAAVIAGFIGIAVTSFSMDPSAFSEFPTPS